MKPITIGIINDQFNFRMINDYINSCAKDPNCENYRYEIIDYDLEFSNDDEKILIFDKINTDVVLIMQSLQLQ